MKKTILALLLSLFAFPLIAQDSTTFAWDYDAVDEQYLVDEGGGFQLYVSKTQNGPYSEIGGTIPATTRQVSINTSTLRGRNYFVVRAIIPTSQSDNSNEISAPFKPETPGNLRNP